MSKGKEFTKTADELMSQAREITGIDLVDEDAVEPLEVLLASLNNDAKLHEAQFDWQPSARTAAFGRE